MQRLLSLHQYLPELHAVCCCQPEMPFWTGCCWRWLQQLSQMTEQQQQQQ